MQEILEILSDLRKLNIQSSFNIFHAKGVNYYCTGELVTDDFHGIFFVITEQYMEVHWEVFEKVKMNPIDAKVILDNVVYLNNLLAREIKL